MQPLSAQLIALISISYVCILFFIAFKGDKQAQASKTSNFYARNQPLVYSLSLAVYCSSWTFFGAVGSAARSGWDFFAIYLGPILVFIFGYKLIQRIIRISKQYSITSISDFLSSRYGKSRHVAVLVTFIAVVGSLPYISLQLHAISMAFTALSNPANSIDFIAITKGNILSDTAFYSALILALFSILFGTRHLSATEHHRGMMNAIAFESLVKFIAIMFVAGYAMQLLFSQFDWQQIIRQPFELTNIGSDVSRFSWVDFTTKLLLSMGVILLLPRQFQVTVVEANGHEEMNTARWMFPLYLLLISLFAVPIAISGLMLLPSGGNADLFVLQLPQQNEQVGLALLAFVGGISAATGMVIVASISLSTMVCNDVVMPFLIRSGWITIAKRPDLSQLILAIRRISIVLILLSSYGYFRLSGGNQQLANMGLLSFAAIIQFAPALIAALYWQRANQRGVLIGLSLGFVTWAYCLLMPNFVSTPALDQYFANFSWLHPHHLFNLDGVSPLSHGVFWSLLINISALVLGSLRFTPSMLDKIQASIFTHTYVQAPQINQSTGFAQNATVKNARILCESIVGPSHTAQLFIDESSNQAKRDQDKLNKTLIEKVERAIAGVIGASSARHIITTQLLGEQASAKDLFVMMDETTQALQFNQDVLRASFENIGQGISVVDKDLKLVAWNSRYKQLFNYPDDLLKIGTPVESLIRYNAERGACGAGEINEHIKKRVSHLRHGSAYTSERKRADGSYIRINGNPIPSGGFVTSFSDVSEQKKTELALRTSESRIRLYTDNLPLMLCFIGQDEKVHFSNKAYNQFVGKTHEEIHNISVHDLFDQTMMQDREQYINRALKGEVVQFRCQQTLAANNGEEILHYQVNYIPQILANGTVEGFFSIYQDITQSVESALLLKKSNEVLEQRVSERTHELEDLNQKLQIENTNTLALSEKVKAVTKSKTRFLAAASHDLLQPINAARLFTNSIIDQGNTIDNSNQNILEKIDSSLISADKLLRALLDISKLDTGNITPTISHFNLHDLLQELIHELSPLAKQKSITLRFIPCNVMVSSDKTLLHSIIQNLISNAIRYTQNGKVVVGCRRCQNDKHKQTVRIHVFDTGSGINDKNLALIFNEFHRIPNAHVDDKNEQGAGQGIGLGLAITKRLAEILDHKLSVISTLNKGSNFSIDVPRHFGEPIPAKQNKTWQPAGNLKNLTVLYLENSRDSLDAMSALLKNWGCEIIACQNYQQAMLALKTSKQTIHMILADYRLDGVETGMDFLNLAKQSHANIRRALVTAEQDPDIKNQTHVMGHLFLSKPVEPAALRGMLSHCAINAYI